MLAQQSYSVNSSENKVYICMYVYMYVRCRKWSPAWSQDRKWSQRGPRTANDPQRGPRTANDPQRGPRTTNDPQSCPRTQTGPQMFLPQSEEWRGLASWNRTFLWTKTCQFYRQRRVLVNQGPKQSRCVSRKKQKKLRKRNIWPSNPKRMKTKVSLVESICFVFLYCWRLFPAACSTFSNVLILGFAEQQLSFFSVTRSEKIHAF